MWLRTDNQNSRHIFCTKASSNKLLWDKKAFKSGIRCIWLILLHKLSLKMSILCIVVFRKKTVFVGAI